MNSIQRPTRDFVMLGSRYSNGRIAKNEQYDIPAFIHSWRPPRISLWDFIRGRTSSRVKHDLELHIREIILKDHFGKKLRLPKKVQHFRPAKPAKLPVALKKGFRSAP